MKTTAHINHEQFPEVSEAERFQAWLTDRYLPIFGADGDGDDGGDDGDDAAWADDSGADDTGDDDGDWSDDDGDDDGRDPADDPAELRRLLAARDQELTKAQQAARRAKADARAERQRKAAESGDVDAIRREYEAEMAELREQLDEASEARAVNEFTLDQERRQNRVTKIAGRMQFRDPSDALALLNEDDTDDDKSTERALRALAREKPYLVDRKKGGLAMAGGSGTRLTQEDIKQMSAAEINARWPEVQKAMSVGGRTGG